MKNLFLKTFKRNKIDERLINEFIKNNEMADSLPELSEIEKIKFDQDVALDHLYYSSKIEGVNLTRDRMTQIINA